MSKQSRQQQIDELIDITTDEEVAIARAACQKYGADPEHMLLVLAAVQAIGLGRSEETAAALRAAADMVNSPIPRIEEIEAIVDGTEGKQKS